ncbi:antichymotrypsin-2-like isoform X3 [Vanessa cardui]|uniref:antichymotrypsin-2-like isoform X3 n=1 Tax=Vanessa cardui TaxID=171605 RepID=UPI001F133183|nr:antichymotrypsin-2-like isoform X3 [Vanessa cardui]
MWIRKTFLLTLVLGVKTVYSANMDSKALTSSIAQFSVKFCNELDKTTSVVSSPLSAEFVLALLTLGTSEPAHSELLTSLGIPGDDDIRSSFSSVSEKLKSIKGVTLNIANKVYIKDGDYDLDEKLKADAIKVFDAALEKVDFSNGAAAADLINKWVEKQTNEKIKELLSADSLGEDTRLVLLNAIYFKGTWKKQFDPANTIDQPFHVDDKTTVDVPMMYKEDDYFYGESSELNAQLLQIPYVGDEASMLIILPNDITGLDSVMTKLAGGFDLLAEMDKMFKTKVQVTIPKFKIETEIDLATLLPKLGIKAIFDCQNSGITKVLNKPEQLYVSKAVQKAFIEVNEEGAEAAAATGMVMMLRCARPPAPRFVADRPFVFALLQARTQLFTGAYRGL